MTPPGVCEVGRGCRTAASQIPLSLGAICHILCVAPGIEQLVEVHGILARLVLNELGDGFDQVPIGLQRNWQTLSHSRRMSPMTMSPEVLGQVPQVLQYPVGPGFFLWCEVRIDVDGGAKVSEAGPTGLACENGDGLRAPCTRIYKKPGGASSGQIPPVSIQKPYEPWEALGMDVAEWLAPGTRTKVKFLVMVDLRAKLRMVYTLKSYDNITMQAESAEEIMQALGRSWLTHFPKPKIFIAEPGCDWKGAPLLCGTWQSWRSRHQLPPWMVHLPQRVHRQVVHQDLRRDQVVVPALVLHGVQEAVAGEVVLDDQEQVLVSKDVQCSGRASMHSRRTWRSRSLQRVRGKVLALKWLWKFSLVVLTIHFFCRKRLH